MNVDGWGEGDVRDREKRQREGLQKLRDNLNLNKKATAFHLEHWRPRKPGLLGFPQPELGQHEADTRLIPSPSSVIKAAKEGPGMTQAHGTAGAQSTWGTEK